MKSVALTVLELLAFYTQNLGGHVTLATLAPFRKIFKGSFPTVPGNTLVKFEVRRLNRFGAISIPPKI